MFHHADLEIKSRENQGVVILDLHGKIEMGKGDVALREYVEDLLEKGNRQLILDLARVSDIDTAGAEVLVTLAAQYKALGGKLVLLKVDKVHAQVYEIARLETVMELCPDEVEAVNTFFPERARAHYDILEYVEEQPHEKHDSKE